MCVVENWDKIEKVVRFLQSSRKLENDEYMIINEDELENIQPGFLIFTVEELMSYRELSIYGIYDIGFLPGRYYLIYDESNKKYIIIRNDKVIDFETLAEKMMKTIETIREN